MALNDTKKEINGVEIMENDTYKYKAFISYRHCSPDSEVAKRLISLIESYNVPAKIIEEHHTDKRVGRLFRDEDELKANSDLSKHITSALDSSEYLIALCSKEYINSKWCMLEAEYWMEHKDPDKIILVLISGRSSEAIPVIFCENGKRPFAIDIRGDTDKGVVTNVDNQKLRIIAALIGCDYEDLRLRNKEQVRRQRAKWLLSVAAAVAVIIALILLYFSVIRIKQNQSGNAVVYGYSYQITSWDKLKSTDQMQIDERYNATAVSCMKTLYDYFHTMSVQERLPYLGISPSAKKALGLNDKFEANVDNISFLNVRLSKDGYANMPDGGKYIFDHYTNFTDNDSLYLYAIVSDGKILSLVVGDDEMILYKGTPDQFNGKVGIAQTSSIIETELGFDENPYTGDLAKDVLLENNGQILYGAEDLSEYILINDPSSLVLKDVHGLEIRQLNSYADSLEKIDMNQSDLCSFDGAAVFDHVTELDISLTNVTDISGIAKAFPNLEVLNCSNIPAEDLSELEQLPLKELNISSISKRVKIDLSKLTQLEALDASDCIFESEEAINDIASLTNLRSLKIDGIRWDDGSYSGSVFSDLSVLGDLSELKELDISNCTIYIYSFIDAEDAEMNNIIGTKDFIFLSNLKKLEVLTFNDMHLEDVNIDFIKDMKNLKEINLKLGQIDCSVFINTENLENVTLTSYDEETFSLYTLKNNEKIKELSFRSNDVSDLAVLENFTQLEELDLHMHDLTSEEVDILCHIDTLKYIKVHRISAKDAKRLESETGCFIFIPD